jgi:pheromone shutdown protein TraB
MAEMTAPQVGARPRRKIVSISLWLLTPLVLVFALPTVLLLAFGLLPAVVAAIVDRREEKYAAYCVGGFNLSGVLPYLFQLWANGDSRVALVAIASSPFTWLVMYGAAALGWLANYWAPQITMRVRRIRDRNEVSRLRRRQEQILEEWGPEVMPPEGS